MPKIEPLSPDTLRARPAPGDIPRDGSLAVLPAPGPSEILQPRATRALNTALSLMGPEFNVFLCGSPNLGRTYFVRDFLAPHAAAAPAPPDYIYVTNYDDPDQPRAIRLAAGQGRSFKAALGKAVAAIREEIPLRLEQEAYVAKRQNLLRAFQNKREEIYQEMEDTAQAAGFSLDIDDQGGLTLYPLVEGKVVGGEDFDRLDPGLRKELKARGEKVMDDMGGYLRRISQEERGLRDREKQLVRETVAEILEAHLSAPERDFGGHEELAAYFKAMREDILENVDSLLPREPAPQGDRPGEAPWTPEDVFARYDVNLFVDNGKTTGAPVIVCDHPSYFNLLGCIERETEMGAMYTDFTLVKAGAIHRANGGYCIIKIDDLAACPGAWEGLLRALRSRLARIEDPADYAEHTRTKTIEPQPIPLSLKVILVGSDETYEALLYGDDRFAKLFKIKAHMQDTVPRTKENIGLVLGLLSRIIKEAELAPFDADALEELINEASLMAEDQQKISLHLPLIRDIMIEAQTLAKTRGLPSVGADTVSAVRKARVFRANLWEEEYLAEYDREMIKVATDGQAVGRANGLSVREYSGYSFGLPHQIACSVGVGHGGILDLEREAELGGPIHTKGMMILKSYLLHLFAKNKPLVMTGSLCFEQSYAEIEGDSASGAELAALLSALAEIPIRLCYAFTGAVSQSGAIMAVGGVNQKIEGFFEVCRRRGLTGTQGVLIPKDNVVNLMLKDEVVEAVTQGKFHIYPVETIEDALEILTGQPAGRPDAGGGFPEGAIYRKVDDRLARMGEIAAK
ncbi:MAG: AAA family ATPase, partial [Desulfovibrionaceae bacterium]|nr:AAA family ATPase [Desulfovibrionaceae bacterium]